MACSRTGSAAESPVSPIARAAEARTAGLSSSSRRNNSGLNAKLTVLRPALLTVRTVSGLPRNRFQALQWGVAELRPTQLEPLPAAVDT